MHTVRSQPLGTGSVSGTTELRRYLNPVIPYGTQWRYGIQCLSWDNGTLLECAYRPFKAAGFGINVRNDGVEGGALLVLRQTPDFRYRASDISVALLSGVRLLCYGDIGVDIQLW
jgi:hypothetical protein